MNQFKEGKCNILICTNVASRGLDLPCVDIVINYDIPESPKVRLAFLAFFLLLYTSRKLLIFLFMWPFLDIAFSKFSYVIH